MALRENPVVSEGAKTLMKILAEYFDSIKEISKAKQEYLSLLQAYSTFSKKHIENGIVARGQIIKYMVSQAALLSKIQSIENMVESFIFKFPNSPEGVRKREICRNEIRIAKEIYAQKVQSLRVAVAELQAHELMGELESFDFDRETAKFVRSSGFPAAHPGIALARPLESTFKPALKKTAKKKRHSAKAI